MTSDTERDAYYRRDPWEEVGRLKAHINTALTYLDHDLPDEARRLLADALHETPQPAS
jgi:hypothetical protein